jgi:hypothetical protein
MKYILVMVFSMFEGDTEITNMVTIDNWHDKTECEQQIRLLKSSLPRGVEISYAKCLQDLDA